MIALIVIGIILFILLSDIIAFQRQLNRIAQRIENKLPEKDASQEEE